MKMNKFFLAAAILLLLNISCTKTDNSGGGGQSSIAASTMTNVAYGTDPLQKMDIYLPANRSATTTKVMILIHGGAWFSGDKSEFAPYIDTLKNRIPDYAIFNLNYRLAALPATNPFPAQELDIKAAVEFIFGNRASYLVSDKFVLMGASAGGHLSLLQAYKYSSPVKIKAVVDFCGPSDMVAMYNDYSGNAPAQAGIVALMNGTPAGNAALYTSSSPLTYAVAGSCPTIIFQGDADAIVNAATQSTALKNKLTTSGVANEYYLYTGLGHVDTWGPTTTTDAFNKIGVFLAAHVQ